MTNDIEELLHLIRKMDSDRVRILFAFVYRKDISFIKAMNPQQVLVEMESLVIDHCQ